MLENLLNALVESKNEAADDLLLEAMDIGTEHEQSMSLTTLLRRKSLRGLGGVVARFGKLSDSLQLQALENIKLFHTALRECGRSDENPLRLAAMKMIALGRQGKMSYVLSENLHELDEDLSKAAAEAMVALARWVATETRALQRGRSQNATHDHATAVYNALIENRAEIETSVARAMDIHRGRHGQDLLRATLLLADSPGSKTLGILHTAKHGGQSPMVRRLQQPPAAEHVEAFLLGASHGQLRSHFGIVFSHIEEAPVLDAILRKTHWLKDQQLQICMHQVSRGVWWGDIDIARDIERRTPGDAALIADWIAASGMHDVTQDERMLTLLKHGKEDFTARLRILKLAMARKRGASVQLIKAFLTDPDERLIRMAAREIIRRRPTDFENTLLQLMTNAPESVRRVVSRAIGQVGFDHFWIRFDRMERATRKQAGRAMLKLLPDATTRLSRRLSSGPPEQRVKALQIVQELNLAEQLQTSITPLFSHPHAKVRSKAVSTLGEIAHVATDVLLEKVLHDTDARVRANAIEVLEAKNSTQFMATLAHRARVGVNRERANAIKAMGKFKVENASAQLLEMLRDERPEHKISAMWTLRQIGWWTMLNEVARLAREDSNMRVKRYALSILKQVQQVLMQSKATASQSSSPPASPSPSTATPAAGLHRKAG